MRVRTAYCVTFIIGQTIVSAVANAASIDVKLNYKYASEGKQPDKKLKYCLEIKPSNDLSVNATDKLQKACALAAGLKNYQIVGKEVGCQKISLALDVEENNNDYTKTAHFSFYDNAGAQPTLNVLASLRSNTSTFNSYSMIALCRATFNDIPPQSEMFHVDASIEPDDAGERSSVSPTPTDWPINGYGAYVMSEMLLNGIGASIGYYFNESVTAEVGYLSLSRALNQDAQSLDKYYVKTRIFFSRKAYVGLGLAWQTAYFDDRYELTTRDKIESLPANAGPSPREFHGSLTTVGGEASLGCLIVGTSHTKGFNLGLDFLGVYRAWDVKRDHLTIASQDPDIRKRIVSKLKDQDTYYVLRLLLGYTF